MKAMFWDLDDTLLETAPLRMRALAHAYETCLGTTTDPWALWRSHRGGTLEDLAKQLVGEEHRRFTEAYRTFYYGQPKACRPFDGIATVLAATRAHGIQHAVITQKVAWGATEELAHTGLLEHFAAVVGFEDTDLHKPDPEPVFHAMDRLLITEPEDIVFIGDSPADIFAARNAGCVSVAALWGSFDAELLELAGPDHMVKTPGELLALVAELMGTPS